jgi:hypothetical protein
LGEIIASSVASGLRLFHALTLSAVVAGATLSSLLVGGPIVAACASPSRCIRSDATDA